jgi:predicted dehydrogenase
MSAPEGRIYAGRTSLALCLGVHDLDVIRWVAGEVTRVYGEAGPSVLDPASADSFVATLRLATGAVASIDLGWALPERTGVTWDTHLVVVGSRASAYLEVRGGDLGGLSPELTYVADVAGVPAGVVRVQDEHFLRAVRDRRTWPGASPADARRALEVALALDRSAAQGEPLAV